MYIKLFALGAAVGALSGYVLISWMTLLSSPTPVWMYTMLLVTGSFFGVAFAALCVLAKKQLSLDRKLANSAAIIVLCAVTFTVAYQVTSYSFFNYVIAASLAGFVTTLFMMVCLRRITGAYSWREAWLTSLLGGALGGAWVYIGFFSTFVPAIEHSSGFVNHVVFFVGWQSFMMLALGVPLFNKQGKWYTNYMIAAIAVFAAVAIAGHIFATMG